jgi:CRP/FNR family transcriptional regulator, cyclic AMP receptor protein
MGDEGVSPSDVAPGTPGWEKMKPTEKSATAIFGRLAQRNRAVGDSFSVRSFRAGEAVGTPEEMSTSLFLVASGRVQLYRTTRDGRRFVVATLGPGSIFGEDSVLGGLAPNTSAVALEAGTVWIMPCQRVLELSSHEAMFTFGLMQAMGQRVVEAENRLEQMAYSSIASRLSALLLDLAGDAPNGLVRVTHQELADMLGTWRETVSKAIQDLRRRGLVAPGRRAITLLDRDGLREEADGGKE